MHLLLRFDLRMLLHLISLPSSSRSTGVRNSSMVIIDVFWFFNQIFLSRSFRRLVASSPAFKILTLGFSWK